VQNEPKLGGTGVCGQRPSYGPWLGRGMKRAKRTQFPATPHGARPKGRGTRGKCAKRTQFARRRRAVLPSTFRPRAPVVQNEPNLARPEGKCAKRTQFGSVRFRVRSFRCNSEQQEVPGERLQASDFTLCPKRLTASRPTKAIVQNKANLRQPEARDNCCRVKRLGENETDRGTAKTKPISAEVTRAATGGYHVPVVLVSGVHEVT
jgi:hypothetical protein